MLFPPESPPFTPIEGSKFLTNSKKYALNIRELFIKNAFMKLTQIPLLKNADDIEEQTKEGICA